MTKVKVRMTFTETFLLYLYILSMKVQQSHKIRWVENEKLTRLKLASKVMFSSLACGTYSTYGEQFLKVKIAQQAPHVTVVFCR